MFALLSGFYFFIINFLTLCLSRLQVRHKQDGCAIGALLAAAVADTHVKAFFPIILILVLIVSIFDSDSRHIFFFCIPFTDF